MTKWRSMGGRRCSPPGLQDGGGGDDAAQVGRALGGSLGLGGQRARPAPGNAEGGAQVALCPKLEWAGGALAGEHGERAGRSPVEALGGDRRAS